MRNAIFLLTLAAVALPAAAQESITRSIPVSAKGRLTLRTEMGAVRVSGGSANTVQVEVLFRGNAPSRAEFDRMLKDFALDVSQQADTVRVDGRFVGGWVRRGFFDWFGGNWNHCRDGRCLEYRWLKSIEYRVTTPRAFDLDVNTEGGSITGDDLGGRVLARTSGGALTFNRVSGDIDARTSGGSITLRDVGGRALLKTSGGAMRFEGVTGDIDAETSGGSITASRNQGNLRVHTSGGAIRLDDVNGSVDASTSGGGIDVRLALNKGFTVDARTSGGGVSADFPTPRRRDEDRNQLRADVNGGGPLVLLRTSGGGISIHSR